MSEPLVEPEGVNAGSADSTVEGSGPDAGSESGADVLGGGRPQDAPGPWDDQDEDAEELAGAPSQPSDAAESGQDEGSLE